MKLVKYLAVWAVLLMAGCASNPMQAMQEAPVKPASGEAQVVFVRDKFLGGGVMASLYDVTTQPTRFIGLLANKTKIAYSTSAGKHTFMVVSEAADFMEADLSAGKTYYALAVARMGLWKARFSLWPISKDPSARYSMRSNDFHEWLADTSWVANSPASLAWYENNKVDVEEKHQAYWEVWQKKTSDMVELRTLKPNDGRAM